VTFFDQQKIFAKEQHGFRLKTSTETAAFSLSETVLKALNLLAPELFF